MCFQTVFCLNVCACLNLQCFHDHQLVYIQHKVNHQIKFHESWWFSDRIRNKFYYFSWSLHIYFARNSLKFGGECKYCRRSSQPNVQLFIILNKVEYPTDSIMNNSVKIKFNFFSVRKYFLHINLIIPGTFLFFSLIFCIFPQILCSNFTILLEF